MQKIIAITSLCLSFQQGFSQSVLDGYIFEQNNRGFLNQASVSIYQLPENYVRGETQSDQDGHFSLPLAPGTYRLVTKKDLFYPKTDTIIVGAEKTYAKIMLQRRPGYLFDASIAETRTDPSQVVDGISGTRVEIYNRTSRRPELILLDHPNAFFQFTFEQGNHYTIMIRKPGFIAKRIEARVNVEGCIICVDGVREFNPGVTENLTAGNTMGTLLSNIELEKVKLDKRITVRNIYYDFDKWDIRKDAAKQLDKVVTLMKDNPGISIELGSHTDARGNDTYNDTLSQKRAEAAVAYIIEQGVEADRITAKGYGETQLTNRCKNGVSCSEEEHQQNRRTELRITAIKNEALEINHWKSLEEIIREETFEEDLKKISQEKEVKIKSVPSSGAPANTSEALPPLRPGSPLVNLPKKFSGYKIELLREKTALPMDHALFGAFYPVFLQKDSKGNFCYFMGNFKGETEARKIFQESVLTQYPEARLVKFISGAKRYVQ